MTNKMKRRLRRLMDAINGALSESEEVTSSLEGVRMQGYDLFLVLEAAVVLSATGEDELDDDLDHDDEFDFEDDDEFSDDSDDLLDEDDSLLEFRVKRKRKLGFVLSDTDMEFLKALRIRCDGS